MTLVEKLFCTQSEIVQQPFYYKHMIQICDKSGIQ